MKAHIPLTRKQCDEVNRRIMAAYKAGCNDGSEQALLFSLIALNNLHGWTEKPLEKVLKETERIAGETQKDPDGFYRMRRHMKELGIEIQGRFYTLPPQYGE